MCKYFRYLPLVAVLACEIGFAAEAPHPGPERPESFFVTPNEETSLAWTIPEGVPAPSPNVYRLTNYEGEGVAQGDLLVENGRASAKIRLPRGYFDIEVYGAKYGIVSQDAFAGPTDPFFGMDAVLTWLDRRAPMRKAMVEDMKRCGIAMARERINWKTLEPEAGKWNWKADDLQDLRQMYAAAGMPVLEMFHSAGPALQKQLFPVKTSYPQDLVRLTESWPVIYEKLKPTWGGLEVWNEPEGSVYGSALAADQYVMVVKAMRYTWEKNRIQSPLGGGVFMGGDPGMFHRFCVLNGLLDEIDFLSIHDYKPATKTEHLASIHRSWLRDHGQEGMPLWLTEAGWSWPKGGGRPPLLPDQESALQITAKGVEAKACGFVRYMPFCLAFYEEGGAKNFAMMGKDVTPLRSMAGYAQSIRVLSGKHYIGDLQVSDASISRARVFEDGHGERVLVACTDAINPHQKITLPAKVLRLESLDGRALQPDADGKIPVPDGLVYAWIDGGTVNSDTSAMALIRASQVAFHRSAPSSPIILQYIPDPAKITTSSTRYIAGAESSAALPVQVRIHNLANTPARITLKLALPGEAPSAPPPQTIDVPALGTADAQWVLDAGTRLTTPEAQPVEVTATQADGAPAARLAIPMQVEGDLATLLAFYKKHEPLKIGDSKRWGSNITANGTMALEGDGGEGIRMAYQFHGGDRWAYPKFALAPGSLAGASGFLVRVRVTNPADLRMAAFGKPGDNNATNITMDALAPADHKWHVVFVPLRLFEPNQNQGSKDGGNWSPDQIKAVSIGLNDRSKDSSNTVEISDFYIVGPGG